MQYSRNVFADSVRQPAPVAKPLVARTLNGMRARSTTSNANVDLFGSIGAMRGKNPIPAFTAAYAENKDYALRIAQWARDVRGGSGEREIYRQILRYLEANDPRVLLDSNLLQNVCELGRFDDLFIFTNPQIRAKALGIVAKAILAGNGLASKWAPRKGPVAIELRNILGLSPKAYRKLLVRQTNVVETQMCAKNWNEINYNHVPSVAMSRYLTAFHKNDPEGMAAYKAALKRNDGTAKVNASAVYPYDVIKMLGGARDLAGGYGGYYARSNPYTFNQVAQSMWDALPDYMNNTNVLAMVDNSGSMQTTLKDSSVSAMDVATSLGLYVAGRSKGAFKDLSLTFNSQPKFVSLTGTIDQRLRQMCSAPWGGSTNLHAAFDLVLNHALQNRVPASDMPKMLLILSDMQFNSCIRHDDSALQMIRRKYENAGYEMPAIVFWNLVDYGNKPVKFNDQGTALISGFSPAIMKSVLAADLEKFSPEAIMLQTIGSDRYNW